MSKSTIRNLIIALLIFTAATGGFFFMIYEVNNKNAQLQSQIEALAKNQAQENSRLKLKRQAEESQQDREQLAGYFFNKESDSIDFLNMVEALAPKAQVALTVDSLEQVVDEKTNASVVEAGFSFNGEYQKVVAFLELLENFPYVSNVTSVELAARSSSNWEATIIMQVDIYAYAE